MSKEEIKFKLGSFELRGDSKTLARAGVITIALYGAYRWIKNEFDDASHSTDESDSDEPESNIEVESSYVPQEESLNEITTKDIEDAIDIIKNILVVGGVLIVFGLPGHGKSTMVMQMLIEIAAGKDSSLWPGAVPLSPVKVIIYDAELSDSQIKKRYGKHGFEFPDNLKRIEDPKVMHSGTTVIRDIKRVVKNANSNLVIAIDNLTKIFDSMSPSEISAFYKDLDDIHSESASRGITVTFIIVGHSTKADPYSAPELADLYGSSFIGNFANTIMAFWPSCYGNDTKFVRVLKNRDNAYDDQEAILMKRKSEPYLSFTPCGVAKLSDVLLRKPKAGRESSGDLEDKSEPNPINAEVLKKARQAKKLLDEGWTKINVAEVLKTTRPTLNSWLKMLEEYEQKQ